MSLWLSYRNLEFSDNIIGINGPGGLGSSGYEHFQYVKFGGLINF
jgi:hypothetical protein